MFSSSGRTWQQIFPCNERVENAALLYNLYKPWALVWKNKKAHNLLVSLYFLITYTLRDSKSSYELKRKTRRGESPEDLEDWKMACFSYTQSCWLCSLTSPAIVCYCMHWLNVFSPISQLTETHNIVFFCPLRHKCVHSSNFPRYLKKYRLGV